MNPRLKTLIADILELDPQAVRPDMRRVETPEWNSLAHLRLMTAFEEQFGVRLSMTEIISVQSAAELESILSSRGVANA